MTFLGGVRLTCCLVVCRFTVAVAIASIYDHKHLLLMKSAGRKIARMYATVHKAPSHSEHGL